MSGSNSSGVNLDRAESAIAGPVAADPALMSFAVHALPSPEAAGRVARRTLSGRLQMLVVLAVCAAPVAASYFAYFVARPQARSNYGELVVPPRPIPESLSLRDLAGAAVDSGSLHGQWLLVVVGQGACGVLCERQLALQRQLHTALGAERDRVDKVWLVDDGATPRLQTLQAIRAQGQAGGAAAIATTTVLFADRGALAGWLQPASGQPLGAHLYLVDPRGDYMLREPVSPEPSRLKRDLDRLLRASASWDPAGRGR